MWMTMKTVTSRFMFIYLATIYWMSTSMWGTVLGAVQHFDFSDWSCVSGWDFEAVQP